MKKLYCFIVGILRTISTPQSWTTGFWSGHTYQDIEEHENVKVTISKCEDCGDIDISWE